MTYKQAFDRYGNPVARRVRFPVLRRIYESCDADGLLIIAGCVIIGGIVGFWLSGVWL